MYGDGVFIHDVCHSCIVIPHEKEIFQRDDAEKLPVLCDITGINRLFIHCRAADTGKRLVNRHVGTERDILRRHDGTGRIVRITEDLIDLLAHFRVCLCKYPFYDVCGHLLDQVNSVVDIELIHNFSQLIIGKALDQQLLKIRIHFHKRLCGEFFREEPE